MKRLFVVLVIISCSASVGYCEVTVEQYLNAKNEEAEIYSSYRVLIAGMGEGVKWSNASLEVRGDKPLYCQPQLLRLNGNNYIKILEEQLGRMDIEKIKDHPIGFILMKGLVMTFPCKD